MQKTSKQNAIFKQNFKKLCQENRVKPAEVLKMLELPSNYVTVLGVVRIATYFKVNISSLLAEQKRRTQ